MSGEDIWYAIVILGLIAALVHWVWKGLIMIGTVVVGLILFWYVSISTCPEAWDLHWKCPHGCDVPLKSISVEYGEKVKAKHYKAEHPGEAVP